MTQAHQRTARVAEAYEKRQGEREVVSLYGNPPVISSPQRLAEVYVAWDALHDKERDACNRATD